MSVSTLTPLKRLREELTSPKVSQETLARRANITLATFRNAERGLSCRYSTAKAILDALNDERRNQGLSIVGRVEDLGLSLE